MKKNYQHLSGYNLGAKNCCGESCETFIPPAPIWLTMNIETLHYLLEEDGFWIFLILQFFFPTSSFCLLAGNLKLHPSEKKMFHFLKHLMTVYQTSVLTKVFFHASVQCEVAQSTEEGSVTSIMCLVYRQATPKRFLFTFVALHTPSVQMLMYLCGQGLSDTQAVTSVYLSFSPPQTQLLSFN